jgi:epoxyqueuosine reductase
MTEYLERKPLALPDGHRNVLLHSCRAPCSGEVMEAMQAPSGEQRTATLASPDVDATSSS